MANKKSLTQQEIADLETKRDELIASWQRQPNGTDDLTLGKVFAYLKIQIELAGYQKKD